MRNWLFPFILLKLQRYRCLRAASGHMKNTNCKDVSVAVSFAVYVQDRYFDQVILAVSSDFHHLIGMTRYEQLEEELAETVFAPLNLLHLYLVRYEEYEQLLITQMSGWYEE